MLYPNSFEQKIGFDKVRHILQRHCISTLGRERVDKMRFSTLYAHISQWLQRTDEITRLLNHEKEEMPIRHFIDIRASLSKTKTIGTYFTEKEVFDIRKSLESVQLIRHFIAKQDPENYPQLYTLTQALAPTEHITHSIDQTIDKNGQIKSNATPTLAQIRREMQYAQNSISKTMNSILAQAQQSGYVDKDLTPTIRDGRLVIPVLPAYKRKIGGIVHDESSTGKTVYVEPTQIVEANNKIRELQSEEKKEIIKILTTLTDEIRPYFQDILHTQRYLGEIDFLRCKYLFAKQIDGIIPHISNQQEIEWKQAKHPLLYLTLQAQQKEIVPLDITLNQTGRILLISGPNAGGKSVCLQTVAILQYMLQCGIPIPIHSDSNAGLFDHIFIDIGDDQSIENDLSTYSSHLLNMKFFLKNSNHTSLILIDEFGTGTEPQIGGAIAEACLERLNQQKTFGIITTHYTNLKHFAEQTEGIVNGAMLYDRHLLQPLFQLEIGNPGSSFAVEIARKIGLPETLIERAAQKVGAEHLDYDKNLQDIVRDKKYWEKKRRDIRLKEKKLEQTLEQYENKLQQSQQKRTEIIHQAQQQAAQLLSQTNAKIENTIKTIKEAKADKEKTKTARKELQTFKEKKILPHTPQSEEKNRKTKKLPQQAITPKKSLSIGSTVKITGQETIGTIIDLNNKTAIVALGHIKTSIGLDKLTPVKQQKNREQNRRKNVVSILKRDPIREKKLNFATQIDVRGMRGDEALQAVMYYIDDALMVDIESVKILHGTGTGALRQMIRGYLDTVAGVKKYHDEHVQFGGAGITVVNF